jgi:hypothetical protein
MPDPKQPRRPKTTEEILAEMEAMSSNVGSRAPEQPDAAPHTQAKEGGALKSLLGFFVKVVPRRRRSRRQLRPPAQKAAPQRRHPLRRPLLLAQVRESRTSSRARLRRSSRLRRQRPEISRTVPSNRFTKRRGFLTRPSRSTNSASCSRIRPSLPNRWPSRLLR